MNIFENYLIKINKVVLDNKNTLNLNDLDALDSVILEIPPEQFNFDFSTNIALVLSKKNKTKPSMLANDIKNLLSFDPIEDRKPTHKNKTYKNAVWNKNSRIDLYYTLGGGTDE